MWLSFIPLAAGWDLAAGVTVELDEAPLAVALALRPEGGRIVVAGALDTQVLDADGVGVAALGAPAAGVLVRPDDLLLCGPTGFTRIAWPPEGPGAPEVMDNDACTELVVYDDGVAVATGADARLWSETLADPEDAGFDLGGDVRLAAASSEIAAASVGDEAVQVLGTRGVSTIAVGAPLSDVVPGPAGWWVALADAPVLRDTDGVDLDLPGPASALTTADVDGDGIADTVMLFPGEGLVGVLPGDGSSLVTSAAPVGASVLAAGDLSGDGCADIAVASGSTLTYLRVTGCPLSPDVDGDGVSAADGDCDDADPGVYPGVRETCDGRDEDCDGEVDESGAAYVDAPPGGVEGEEVLFWASFEGCGPEATWTWTDPSSDWVSCSLADAVATCTTSDDGALTAHADALDGSGAVIGAVDVVIEVANAAPVLIVPSEFADGDLGLWIDDSFEAVLDGEDVAGDALTFFERGGPSWFRVAPDGRLQASPESVGAWDVEVGVRDDDGGETSWPLYLYVDGPSDSGPEDEEGYEAGPAADVQFSGCGEEPEPAPACTGSGCCGGSNGVAVVLALALLRRSRGGPVGGSRSG